MVNRISKNKLINQDKHPDESKTRTHRFSKLSDDGNPWAPNNLLIPEQKKNISWTPVGQATDKKLRPQPTMIGLKTIIKACRLSHNIQVITYTSVTCNDFSKLKRNIISSYKFLKFVNQVTIKFWFRKALI